MPSLTVQGGEDKTKQKKREDEELKLKTINEEQETIRKFEETKEFSSEDKKRDRRETDKEEQTTLARKKIKFDMQLRTPRDNTEVQKEDTVDKMDKVEEVFQRENNTEVHKIMDESSKPVDEVLQITDPPMPPKKPQA